jgi:twitching motility protein PilT
MAEFTLNQLLDYTVSAGASDLHILVGYPPMIRVDGNLVAVVGTDVLRSGQIEKIIASSLSSEQYQLFIANKDLDYSFSLEGRARFRVNAYFQKGVQSATFRLIPLKINTIDNLGLPQICHKFIQLKQGFILVTGPTGSGKSTTLAAIIEEINQTRPAHIITIEDPIEFVYRGAKSLVSQREIKADTLSWSVALKAVLREDPDVVLIGEMRDYETIAAALTIAETGHLVLASLHTNSAAQTIDRIVDVFPQDHQSQVKMQLSSTLEAVVSQRLVPKKGNGRSVVCEIMLANDAVRTAIREGKTHMIDNILTTSREKGMQLLETDLAKLVKAGVLDFETARNYSMRPNELIRQMA